MDIFFFALQLEVDNFHTTDVFDYGNLGNEMTCDAKTSGFNTVLYCGVISTAEMSRHLSQGARLPGTEHCGPG